MPDCSSNNTLLENTVTQPTSLSRLCPLKFPSSIPSTVITPELQIINSGNPDVGKVNIIKQVHTVHNEGSIILGKIGVYQAQILNTLITTRPHHDIFMEGLQNDFPNCNSPEFSSYCYTQLYNWVYLWNKTSERGCADYIREKFSGYSIDTPPNNIQEQYLGALGAAVIFAICYTDVSLHKTTDFDFETKLVADQAKRSDLPRERVIEQYYNVREERACRGEIDPFLREHPGAEVIFLIGNLHHLDRSPKFFRNSPQIVAYDWPDLTQRLGWRVHKEHLSQN